MLMALGVLDSAIKGGKTAAEGLACIAKGAAEVPAAASAADLMMKSRLCMGVAIEFYTMIRSFGVAVGWKFVSRYRFW